MKKLVLLLLCSFTSINLLRAQTCGADGITFTDQASIDNFKTNYPGCTQILGRVLISKTPITNLNGLLGVTHIGGGLSIGENPNLTNLDGLDKLITVNGWMSLFRNPALSSLKALKSVTYIEHLDVSGNAFTDFSGLESLTRVEGWLNIGSSYITSLKWLNSQLDFDDTFSYSKIIVVNAGKETVKVYPNPSRGRLHIETINRNQPYSIKNVQGFSVMESAVLPVKELDTSSLQNGLYLLTVGKEVFKVFVDN